jgi:hypothetical protein
MRYPKFLINAFATLGVFAFIFLACSVSADNSSDEEVVIVIEEEEENPPPPVENNYGKYQIEVIKWNEFVNYTTILNTETGEVKFYMYNGAYYVEQNIGSSGNLGGF